VCYLLEWHEPDLPRRALPYAYNVYYVKYNMHQDMQVYPLSGKQRVLIHETETTATGLERIEHGFTPGHCLDVC
jgi:hypothetical protein